ncbi:similar to Saccharomyces cerevisiae YBR289W SNF5 Subunit of the SWI/SNF chromatin remodeling complex involved in transcriptional regulation [Maudiozyma saulgeensis]|uniref:Similar to Saccharomyces cerevisiae YBR289W SNF5 Subunit of the SWI/SNF chromatin remodeling complex involved in transcriptional regulation n=1 Tax=Maudiozyma saulgeensis TaxID=1789683 RepID=A0A1X7QWE3_9SACH|nr:similar to Saccharomyces cerevisiae YBR289W SNF5 Subunit of the SWI/SNF chromatin remodeling complex involved in transcriptional regulation [Kazachstania saulgeensis]
MNNNNNQDTVRDVPIDGNMQNNNSNNNFNDNNAPPNASANNSNTNNDPNNIRNVFSNIGTPSFSFSQIPQHILQSLTQQQLRMIQQRHQQLLLNRIQQQQQMQQQNGNVGQSNMNDNSTNNSRNSNTNNNNMRAANLGSNSNNSGINQMDTQAQQAQQAPQGNTNNNNPIDPQQPGMINLPPQIAQLALPAQIQVLNTLKQQAMLKENPAAVTTITMALQQVQQRYQQQLEQGDSMMQGNMSSMGPSINNTSMNAPAPQKNTPATKQTTTKRKPSQKKANSVTPHGKGTNIQSGAANKKVTSTETQKPKRKAKPKTPKNQVNIPTPVPAVVGETPQINLQMPLPELELPRLELPKFQTIKYDPKETKLPATNYWSSKSDNPSTDTLLYEQIIKRDERFKEDHKKESQGYEPFSIYGFSNKEYIAKQFHVLKYYQDLKNTRMQSITLTSKNIPAASIWGTGYAGYGNGNTNEVTNIIPEYIPTGMRKNVLFDDEIVYKDAMSDNDYNTRDQLVPIRLEFDQERDKFFLRDTLLWNKNDKLVNINEFVKDMLMDYRFDESYLKSLTHTISRSIKDQILKFQPNPYIELNQYRVGGDDLRIKIKLDIVVGQNQLIDQFEWDISNTENDAEEFAENMCQELQLPGEFQTAISHSIREQVHMYHKSLALLGYTFDGQPVEDDDIRSRLVSVITLDDIFRPQSETKVYTPNLLQISAAELERLDKDKDRDTRRKRRQGRFNRRGYGLITANSNTNLVGESLAGSTGLLGASKTNVPGSASGISSSAAGATDIPLPDLSDLPRTFRTPIPTTLLPGGVDFGPSVNSYDLDTTIEYKPRPAGPKPPPPPCYVIDNIPGKSLLLCIKLKKKDSQGNETETNPERDSSIKVDNSSQQMKRVTSLEQKKFEAPTVSTNNINSIPQRLPDQTANLPQDPNLTA